VSGSAPETRAAAVVEAVGYDAATDRELFLLGLDGVGELPAKLRLPTRHFACLLVLDGRPAPAGDVQRTALRLLQEGAVYLSVWGPDCERIRSLVDDTILISETEASEESIVLTADHEAESLEAALAHLLECSVPASRYVETCRAALVVVVNAPGWALACREALCDPRGFVAGLAVEGV